MDMAGSGFGEMSGKGAETYIVVMKEVMETHKPAIGRFLKIRALPLHSKASARKQ